VYVLPALPEPERTAAALRGLLSHESAAQYWGIQTLQPPTSVHVTVPHGAHPQALPGVVIHQTRTLAPPPSQRWERSSATEPLATVLDCATALPFRDALAIADSALALRFVTSSELLAATEASRGPGRPVRLMVARYADPRAQNPLESALRAIVIECRICGFVPQCPVQVGRREWHLDLGDPDRRVALEAEGYEHHGSREALVRDCERYDELGRRGWLVLRFAWEQVMFRPEWVGEVLVDALAVRRRVRTA